MKKALIFAIFILGQTGYAQPFIDMESKWVETEQSAPPLPFMNSGMFFRISQVVGDTSLNGQSYYQVLTHTDEYELTAAGDTVDVFSYDNLWFLRQEENRIYKLRPTAPDEKLLFDFNLSLGDTAYINESYTEIWIVEEIFETVVNEQTASTFRLKKEGETDTLLLYQGIGASTGFYDGIKPPCCAGEQVSANSLDCFSNTQGVHAFDTAIDYCEAEIVSVAAKNWIGVEVFPNPATHTLQFQLNNFQSEQATLTVHNAAGQLQHREKLKLEPRLQQHQVDVSAWPLGVYFLRLKAGARQVVRRLVKK